ncbi:MAG: ferrochelatase [Acidobacteria bacterium]|nr:ferrochelatase [Acidobacteriota bacterium]
MARPRPVGVVLFQLGGPDCLDAVEPFLFNLFSDPDIIEFPFSRLTRPAIARLLARRRAAKVREHYREIGGGSPLLELTRAQAAALEAELRRSLDTRVWVAMRYWHPLIEEVIAQIREADLDELVLLPLYPQYSKVTTGSSLNEWERRSRRAGWRMPVKIVPDFYRHTLFLDALVEKINSTLARFPAGEPVTLVFSAHGVPMSVIEAGDPYQEQTEATVRLVMERGGWSHPHLLCYQSRVGPGRWTEPMLHTALERLRPGAGDGGGAGARNVLVIPISFVTEHIETLHEIDLEARAQAASLGFARFEMMPALNDSPTFIRALADLVLTAVSAEVPSRAEFS